MKVITCINELRSQTEGDECILLLFSGGLDSCHTLSQLTAAGFRVVALFINLGDKIPTTCKVAQSIADEVIITEAEYIFCEEYLADGIICDATYFGGMPLSSTYTRPMMARLAVEQAHSRGIHIIASNVTAFQNTFFRLAKSIEVLAPEFSLFCPSIGDYLDRAEKIAGLDDRFIKFFKDKKRGIYSVDENLWCRVVENGDIEHPERSLPISDIYETSWTGVSEEVAITFKAGLPVALNDTEMELGKICRKLNEHYAGHPYSFSYGLEGNVFGVKNPEPRISMAGKLIHEGSGYIAQAVLSAAELQLRDELSRRFAISIIEGGWFTSYANALRAALYRLAKPISGRVSWQITERSCFVNTIAPEKSSKVGAHLTDFTCLVESFDLSKKIIFDLLKEHTHA